MTKSTGKMERQRRREELFAAELTLRRVEQYLFDRYKAAQRCRDVQDAGGYLRAYAAVTERRVAVVMEFEELP